MPRDPAADALLRAFGAKVREVRLSVGMSQAEVAHAADLHPTYISGIESGRRNASILSLYAVASALGVAAGDLVPTSTR